MRVNNKINFLIRFVCVRARPRMATESLTDQPNENDKQIYEGKNRAYKHAMYRFSSDEMNLKKLLSVLCCHCLATVLVYRLYFNRSNF